MNKNESTAFPLIASVIYMVLDIIYMINTSYESFLIDFFRSSIVGAIIVCAGIFIIVFAMSRKAELLTLGIAVPLTVITYIGGLRSIPVFSLQGIIYIWLTMLIFSSIVYVLFFAGGHF